MGKNHSKKKKQKPFNTIRNAEKLQELRPKLRKLESDDNGTEPGSDCHASNEREEQMFSKKDRKMILHIRELFPNNGETVEYFKETNGIIFPITKGSKMYPILVSCYSSVLHIFSMENINVNNSSNKVLKHIMGINFRILMGGFQYNTKKDCFVYQMTVPLYEKPKKEFIGSLLTYSVDILEEYVPEIISSSNEASHQKREHINPTFH